MGTSQSRRLWSYGPPQQARTTRHPRYAPGPTTSSDHSVGDKLNASVLRILPVAYLGAAASHDAKLTRSSVRPLQMERGTRCSRKISPELRASDLGW
jgi:hypothetical protein